MKRNLNFEPLSHGLLELLKTLQLRLQLLDPHHGTFETFAQLHTRRQRVQVVVLKPGTRILSYFHFKSDVANQGAWFDNLPDQTAEVCTWME